jgi:serine/threonine-protein kinase HipA
LREADILLMVDDESRQGALRFAEQLGGPFLRSGEERRVPPLIHLRQLLVASEHVEDDTETAEEIRLLSAPGSSLGGTRPKASVRHIDGSLAIAKFPHKSDTMRVELWEALALSLAEKAEWKRAARKPPPDRLSPTPLRRALGSGPWLI